MTSMTIRMDPEAVQALAALTSTGRSRSEAVRAALLLAYEQQRSAILRAEAEEAARDPDDLAEIRAIREELDVPGAW